MPFYVYGPYGVEKVVKGFNEAFELNALFRGINSENDLDPEMSLGIPKLVKLSQHPKEVYRKGDLRVSSFSVSHEPVFPALGYVLNYKNCKIVISGDTTTTPTLADASKEADVLISEAFSEAIAKPKNVSLKSGSKEKIDALREEGMPKRPSFYQIARYHLKTDDLAKMAAASNVKRLFLSHLIPVISNSQSDKDRFVKDMDKYYKGPITVADDGYSLVVESTAKGCSVQYVPNTLLQSSVASSERK